MHNPSQENRDLIRRVFDFVPGFDKELKGETLTFKGAKARMLQYAELGSYRQKVLNEHGQGIALLNIFPPGTILREKSAERGWLGDGSAPSESQKRDESTEDILYTFWCVGDLDLEQGVLTVWNCFPRTRPFLSVTDCDSLVERQIRVTNKKKEVEHEINGQGVLMDLLIDQQDSTVNTLPHPDRHTVQIDVMQRGTSRTARRRTKVEQLTARILSMKSS